MNKLFNKIAALSVGLAMAIGVGVAIGSHSKAESRSVKAAVPSGHDLLFKINFKDNGTDSTTALTAANFYSNGVTSVVNGSNADITSTFSAAGLAATPNKTYAGTGGLKCGSNKNAADFTLNIPAAYQDKFTYVVVNCTNATRDITITAASKSGTVTSGNSSFGDHDLALSCTTNATTLAVSIASASKTAAYISYISVYKASSGGSTVAVTGVSLDQATATVKVGKTVTLTPTITPNNATDQSVSWSTSDSSVATVANGVVTGVAAGNATITVTTTDGGFTATCAVTVQAIQTINATVAQARTAAAALTDGDTTADLYCVTGYVTNVSYTWSSSNGVSFSMADAKDGTPTLEAFKIKCSQEIGLKVLKDAQLTVTGNLKNYGGTYEVINNTGVATPITILQEAGTNYPEPSLVTGEDLSDLFANTDGNGKQLYQVTGVVSAWYSTNTNGTKYGNFYLQEPGNTSTSYLIYGATATASALVWNSGAGNYVFTNPQDFLTDTLTKDIAIGDTVTMKLTRCDYNSTPEAQGIVVSVSHAPTISVSPATLQLTENGSTGTITASPENAGGASVVWTTSDATVATVSGGTVTPEGIGSATITAFIDLNSNGTLDSGEPSASCTVTVSAEPVSIDAEGTYTLVSDDSDLASGDVILITNDDGTKALSTTQNDNNRDCTNTGIDNGEIIISGSTTIQALLLGTSNGHFTFFTGEGYLYAASSSKNYLRTESTLDDNGEFTISIANDVATITAQGTNTHNLLQYNSSSSIFSCYGSSQQDICIYKKGAAPVDPTKVTGVTLDSNSATIGAGETVTLTATVSPSTALDKSVSWSTSDPNVATVANGVVTGVGAGTATITVTTTDGNKTATCEVTVRTISLGFFYQVTDASTLTANDKVVIAAHVGDNIKVMENVSPDAKKMPSADVASSSKWTDTFGNQTVKSFRHDTGSTLWTVSGDSTGWTFSNGSTELYANASNTNLYTAASGSTLVLSSGTHGTFRLAISGSTRAVAYQVSGNVFGHYATSNIDGSAYYDVEIYKLVENPTVLTGLTCTGTGSYTGDWSSLTTAFGNLTLGEKAYYKHASYTVSGEGTETVVTATDGTNASVAAFVAKYDYIVAKYGTTSNPDFIGRNPSPLNSGRISFFGSDATNSGPTLAIIIASILSLTVVGGYFVIRKRKYTK